MVSCQWQEEAACDTLDRAGLAACAAGDQLLVFGGRAGAKLWADVLAYDTVARRWTVACDKWPYEPRSYHTVTRVGDEIWICGGGNIDTVLGGALVYNPTTRTVREPRLVGDVLLLRRTAHGACLHPLRPDCILLVGGYGGEVDAATQEYRYLNDLVEINTRTGVVRALAPSGVQPETRAYHTFTAVGDRCFLIGGRTHSNRLCKGKQLMLVYDATADRWFAPAPGAVSGELSPRSSHRAVGVPGGLMIFGGAVDRGEKSNDLMLLTVGGHSRLTWRACLPPSDSAGSHAGAVGWPGARGAHAAEVVCGRLYVLGGYGEGKKYTGDCWSISLEVAGTCDAAPPAAQQEEHGRHSGSGSCKQAAVPEASQWRDARRSRPAAAFVGSEPQAAKRQRVAGGGRKGQAAAAPAAAAAAARLPASAPPLALQAPESSFAIIAVAAPCEQQQQQQQQGPPSADQEARQLREEVQRLQLELAKKEQLAEGLQRENAMVREQRDIWRDSLEKEQALMRDSSASIIRNKELEIADLQQQLAAARREREEAKDAASRAESELHTTKLEHRRLTAHWEQHDVDRQRIIDNLKRDLSEARERAEKAQKDLGARQCQLDEAQAALDEEQRVTSDLRKKAGEERQDLQRQIKDEKSAREATQREVASLQARLEGDQKALQAAKAELERQAGLLQQERDKCAAARQDCEAARRRVDELKLEVEQQRASDVQRALSLDQLRKYLEGAGKEVQNLQQRQQQSQRQQQQQPGPS